MSRRGKEVEADGLGEAYGTQTARTALMPINAGVSDRNPITRAGDRASDRIRGDSDIELVVIGASAGALEALSIILPALPIDYRPAVAIVVHLAASRPSLLAELLARKCALPVREALDKEPVKGGTVFVAAPDYHLLVERERSFALSVDGPVNYSRPSIDVLFESAADAYGRSLVGVILTGANEDGAWGLSRVRAAGGRAIVQDPATAEVPVMPARAIANAKPDHVLPLSSIGPLLVEVGKKN